MNVKEEFISLYKSYITRPGSEDFLNWLEKTDFYVAPASTRFHLAHEGGLAEHSIHVYERLRELYSIEKERNMEGPYVLNAGEEESIAIVGLLHDVCKTNYYRVELRNRKNDQGQWEQVPFYTVDDQLPYGHGEKSVYIISGFMKLRRDEAFAIRYHMGPWQEGESRNASAAFDQFPLALLAHIADMQATHIDEKE